MIYVICPANVKTGGTELLHQLVYQLNKNQIEAQICYYGIEENMSPRPKAFECYVKEFLSIDQIIDEKENIMIVPEIGCWRLKNVQNMKKIIWWLSVDNYLMRANFRGCKYVLGMKPAIKKMLKREFINMKEDILNSDLHLCQSEYSMKFLESMNIETKKIKYLSDYINDSYIDNVDKIFKQNRENIVLYNPAKGYKFTKKLIKSSPEIKWVPLKNMTNDEIKSVMLKSKVYVDFGNHPGKDRLPREAAISGCCIITGMRGAAKYYEDVRIPSKFKFDQNHTKPNEIINTIYDCFENFEERSQEFEQYRTFICGEKKKFEDDVKNIFFEEIVNG